MSNAAPNDWSKSRLGEYIGVQGGNAFKSELFVDSGIPVIRISNIKKDGSVTLDNAVHTTPDESLARFEVEDGDILIAMSGATTGKVGRYRSSKNAYLNQRVGRFFSKGNSDVNLSFIHQITSEDNFVNSILIDAVGGAQPNISNQQIESISVALPPLPEQQKIAAILSSVDDVIEKTQAQIDKLKDLKTGMMQELLTKGVCDENGKPHTEFKDSPVGRIPVGWDVKPLGELVNPEKNITYGIVQAGPYCEGGVPYIRVSDMTVRKLSRKGMLLTSPEIAEKYKRSAVSTGDIVYALRGVIGHVQLVPFELNGANLTQGTARISPNEQIDTSYLVWAMKSPYVEYQNDLEAKGSTFREVTLASLRKIEIAVPTIDEQQKIASCLDSVESKVFAVEDKLSQLQSIKKALMQDLLTGKVRVTVD